MKELTHIDLFAGIGGNSLAFDTIFHETKNTHIFCEIEPFPRAILRKLWPDAVIHDDVRTFASDAAGVGHIHGRPQVLPTKGSHQAQRQSATGSEPPFILTGGFPCQPFSQAGRRKGTEDDRYLWPPMLGVIRHTKPTWVIAENVRGLVTWNDGMVLETVCSDLESEGYEVQPLIIPAVAVGAPHRRDRIWFIAYYKDKHGEWVKSKGSSSRQSKKKTGNGNFNAQNSISKRRRRGSNEFKKGAGKRMEAKIQDARSDWRRDWHEVAARLCGMDDGLPAGMDGAILSSSAHRKARLKALGNAIVPQVAMEIMQAIKQTL